MATKMKATPKKQPVRIDIGENVFYGSLILGAFTVLYFLFRLLVLSCPCSACSN